MRITRSMNRNIVTMNDYTREKATRALRKGVEAMKESYAATEGKPLHWWQRALWVLLAGMAAAACFWLASCSASYCRTAEGSIRAAVSIVRAEEAK